VRPASPAYDGADSAGTETTNAQGQVRHVAKKTFAITLLLMLTIVVSGFRSTEAQNYYTRTYNYRTGLPPSYFYDLAQDSVGRIWGVNAAGLYSFNGLIWEKHPIPLAEDDIRGDHPRKLHYHRNSNSLYVYYDEQTVSNYYYRFDGKSWSAIRLNTSLIIHDLVVGDDQHVWLATDGNGLLIVDPQEQHPITKANGLCSDQIYDLEYQGRELLAAGEYGINTVSFRSGSIAVDTVYSNPNGTVPLIAFHKQTGLLFKVIEKTHPRHSPQFPGALYQLQDEQIERVRLAQSADFSHLAIDSKGSFYTGSKSSGLMKYSADGPVIQFRQKDSPVANQLSDVLIGRNDEVWISHPLGINVFYQSPFYHYTTVHGFAENYITAIAAGNDSIVYFGHPAGRLTRLHRNQVQTITLSSSYPQAGEVTDLAFDSDGNLLIASQNPPVLRLAHRGHLSEIHHRDNRNALTYTGFIHAPDDVVYLSARDTTSKEYSEHLFRISGDTLLPAHMASVGPDTLLDYRCADFDTTGTLYVKYRNGSARAGILEITPDGTHTYYPSGSYLLGNVINDILVDSRDRIWVAQRGGVALRMDGRWTSVTARDNIQSSIIHSIFEDRTGGIWIVGNIDVSRYHDGRITSYTFKEGLFEKEISRGGGVTDDLGRVWVGTDRGVYMHNIAKDLQPAPEINLAITGLLVDGIHQPVTSNDKPITLPHSIKSLEIQFESVYLRSPGKVYYQTKMEGLNDTWSARTSQNSVLYSHLSPGKYQFRVRAGIRGFSGREITRSLPPIRIDIPLWQNPYVLAGVVFTVLLIGLGTLQVRYTLKKRTEERLTQEVREKTKKIRALNAEILRIEDKQREHIATELHDRVAQYLAMARNYISYLKDSVKDSRHVNYLQSAYRLINQSIDDTRLLIRELNPPVLEEFGLLAAIEWLSEQMNEHYQINTRVVKHVNGQLASKTDIEIQTILFQAVRELLNNVVKHANATEVTLKISESRNMLWITVHDDGTGFDPATDFEKNGNAGFGLRNIRMRLEQIEGQFEIRTRQSEGTTVKVGAPKSINSRDEQEYTSR